MKFFKVVFWAVYAAVGVGAETKGWQSSGHVQVPIWPKAAPDPQPVRGPEVVKPSGNTFLVAGKQVIGGVLRCHLVAAKGSDHKQSALKPL